MHSRLVVVTALATVLALAHGASVPLPAPTPVVVDGAANTTTPAPPRTPPPSPAAAKITTDAPSVASAPKPHRHKRVAAAPAAARGAGAAADCAAAHQWGATTLPSIIIRTATPGRLTRNKTRAAVAVCSPDGSVDWSGAARARVRGGTNSQKRNVVLQYALTDFKADNGGVTANNGTQKGAAALAGMPAGTHFILLGQSVDPLGVKAWAGLELARVMPALESNTSSTTSPPLGWTPRAKFVEVFMVDDGAPFSPSTHYLGTRVLAEHIEPGANRVPLGPGGWIATFLHGEPDPEGTPLPAAVTHKEWLIKYPTKPNMPAATLAAATATLAAFERGAIDRVGDWRAAADEASFVDWFVVMELIKATKHTYHSAAFSHVLSSSAPRLRMGPIWNVLQGFGTCCGYPVTGYLTGGVSPGPHYSGGGSISPNGWLFNICTLQPDRCAVLDSYDKGNGISVWFDRLFYKDPTFAATAAARWRALRAREWSDAAIRAIFDRVDRDLGSGAGERSLARWTDAAAWGGAPRDPSAIVAAVRGWTLARLAWLDGAWAQAADPATRAAPYKEAY